MKTFKIFYFLVLLVCLYVVTRQTIDPYNTTSQTPKEPTLTVKDFAYAVPLRDISTVNLWKLPGAKNTPNNEVLATLNASTRVGILERKSFGTNSVYFHVEIEDGTRGFIGKPFISKDASGNTFYEKNPKTGEILRDGSGYSFSQVNNCILHIAALPGNLEKGEFETTTEFEQRKQEVSSKIPWFNNDITYTYLYSIEGNYNADNQIFAYETYSTPEQMYKLGEYKLGGYASKDIPFLQFDNNCAKDLNYKDGVETLLQVMNTKMPTNFTEYGTFDVKKRVNRADAPNYKYTNLFIGVKPKSIQGVRTGSKRTAYHDAVSHDTTLNGELSYVFLITRDGKNVIESYVSPAYKNSWQKDLQSQLAIAGYEIGLIDGLVGEATKKAIEEAVEDGILPNAEISIRTTMLLIFHNMPNAVKKKSNSLFELKQ